MTNNQLTPDEIIYCSEPLLKLKKLNKVDGTDSNTYLIKNSEPFSFMRYEEGGIKRIKPVKCSSITEGKQLKGYPFIVKSLDYTNIGWTVYLLPYIENDNE